MIFNQVLHRLSASKYNSKIILVIMCVLVAALLTDISIIKISEISANELDSSSGIVIFTFILAIYVIGQYFILEFVKHNSRESRTKEGESHLDIIHKMVTITQYVLTALLIFVVVEMVMISYYNVATLIVSVSLSYTLVVVIMSLLAQRFFLWFRSNRNSVVLLYGLSAAMLAINAVFTLAFVSDVLINVTTEMHPHVGGLKYTNFAPNSITSTLNYAYFISSIIAFVTTWGATSMLLYHYSKKLGKVRYWFILSIPLIYFLSQFLSLLLNLFSPLLQLDPVFYGILFTLIFTLSKPIGGVLFGIAFWTITKNLSRNIIRDYTTVSAYGLVLLFISNQGVVITNAPYPPFGLVTISFVGLSSYLILVGIYSSAISVAQDVNLRKSIRTSAIEQSKLLDSIASAQMEQEIERRVIKVTREQQHKMEEETGIESSVDENDIKQYINEVLQEVKGKKGSIS
jgi:hypothetical protein